MVNRGNDGLRKWLEAEAAGDENRADEAFASVFADHVPSLGPPAPVWDAEIVRRALPGGARRWLAVAAGLALVAGGLAAAAFWSAWVFDLLGAAGTVGPRVLAVATGAGRHVITFLQHAWLPAVAVGRALAVATATGPAAAAIALNLTVAFAAAIALSRLLSPEEE
jgi:hypothetical protein